jgi:hypothetical protein
MKTELDMEEVAYIIVAGLSTEALQQARTRLEERQNYSLPQWVKDHDKAALEVVKAELTYRQREQDELDELFASMAQ